MRGWGADDAYGGRTRRGPGKGEGTSRRGRAAEAGEWVPARGLERGAGREVGSPAEVIAKDPASRLGSGTRKECEGAE